jgi:hypothetical protein
MTPSKSQDYAAAIHESGHVAARRVFDLPFSSVYIHKVGDEVIGGVYAPKPDEKFDPTAVACAALAGPLSEVRYTGDNFCKQALTGRWRTDIANAILAVTPNEEQFDFAAVARLIPYVDVVVEREWPVIQLIARHLQRRRSLTFDQVRSLLWYFA